LINNLKSYINFIFKSSNQHGVHSPFVYNFITKCLYNSNYLKNSNLNQINAFIASLKNNHNIITVTDFGAGSRVFKNSTRKISAIARNAGISKKRAKLLIKIGQYFHPINILEIGTSLGIGTACLNLGNPKSKITTLEGCPETSKIAQNQFNKFGFKNINMEVGNFNDTLSKALENKKYDLIYFDGNHQKDATIKYFEQCLPATKNDSIFIFDDIHWSQGMEEAWNHIKEHKKVTISIDTYQWGIVFFRKEQPKEHFIIRV